MKHVDRNLLRGPRPTDLELLTDAGIRRVIGLESGLRDFFCDDPVERQQYEDHGIAYYDLSSSIIWPPKDWVVEKFLDLMREQHVPTYIHCYSGVDRTGFLCAVYRMRVQGWTFAEAHKEWVELGRHLHYAWWSRALRKWASK